MAGLDTITESGSDFYDAEDSLLQPQTSARESENPMINKEASALEASMTLQKKKNPVCVMWPLAYNFVATYSCARRMPSYSDLSMHKLFTHATFSSAMQALLAILYKVQTCIW